MEPQPLAAAAIHVEVTADHRFGTNSYLVEDELTHDAAVVDANLEPDEMIELVRRRGASVKAILLTHTDIDHIGGLHQLIDAFGPIRVAVHAAEKAVVAEGRSLRREFGEVSIQVGNVVELEVGEVFKVGSLAFEVMHTPGHSPGGVTLKIGSILFTGDALFAGSIGRSDFSNSNAASLLEGIRANLMKQPDDLVVFSGHGPATTIGRERRTNPFLA